jgi:hypothetical protein
MSSCINEFLSIIYGTWRSPHDRNEHINFLSSFSMYTKGFSLYILPIDFENNYNLTRCTSVLEDTLSDN